MSTLDSLSNADQRARSALRRHLSPGLIAMSARASTVAASALYALTILFAYRHYLYPQWEYLGFSHRQTTSAEVAVIAALVVGGAMVIPSRLLKPSGTILLYLFAIVYVPGIVILFCVDADRFPRYVPVAIAMLVAFACAGLAARLANGHSTAKGRAAAGRVDPGAGTSYVFGLAWCLVTVALVAEYHSIMAFASLESVYNQREVGQSRHLWTAYAMTYYGSVINPGLLALGLVYRRKAATIAAAAGFVILYLINAQKTALLLPVITVGYYFLLNSRSPALTFTALPILFLTALSLYSVLLWEVDIVASVLALLLVHRTIATPGLTLSQYFEQFQTEGFTLWSHVKLFDWIIPVPAQYIGDPNWPGLGYMLGDRLFGMPEFNMNANLFSGDGIAAFGALGVIAAGVFLAGYLYLFDRITSRCDQRFSQLISLPVAIALTNGHFFTTLLSFGGIFWIVYFVALTRTKFISAAQGQPGTIQRATR